MEPRLFIISVKWTVGLLSALWFVLAGPGWSANQATSPITPATHHFVQIKNGQLSVQLHNIPLQEVFEEVAKLTSIKTLIYASPKERLSIQFKDLPLEDAIRRLTQKYNTLFVYGPEYDRTGNPKLCEVVILSKTYQNVHGGHGPLVIRADHPRPDNPKAQRFESIIEALHDQDETTRELAIERLAASPDARVVDTLLEVMVNDPEVDVRAAAASVIGELRDQTSVNALIAAMQDDDVWMRENVVEALGKIGGAGVIETLRAALQDEDEDVREAASKALYLLED